MMNITVILLIVLAFLQLFIFYLIHYNRRQSIGYFTECLSRVEHIESKLDDTVKDNDKIVKRLIDAIRRVKKITGS